MFDKKAAPILIRIHLRGRAYVSFTPSRVDPCTTIGSDDRQGAIRLERMSARTSRKFSWLNCRMALAD